MKTQSAALPYLKAIGLLLTGRLPRTGERARINLSRVMICTRCGSIDGTKSHTKGTMAIELVLWCCFIVPGLIYSFWRLGSRGVVCTSCEGSQLVKATSPVGAELMQRFHPQVLKSAT
jgi:hypothetical protein